MRRLIISIFVLAACISISSCVMTASAQTDGEYVVESDVSIVLNAGTPYYNVDGLLVYYIYRGMYYYPFYSNGRYYLHRYARPVPRHLRHHYAPVGKGHRPRVVGGARPTHRGHGGSVGRTPSGRGHNVAGSRAGRGGFGGRR